jgi:dipeptidase D
VCGRLGPGAGWLELTADAAQVKGARPGVDAAGAARGKPFVIELTELPGKVRIAVTGLAVHSSTADEGHNAMWPLASVARRLGVGGSAGAMLKLVNEWFDGDLWGKKLDVAYADPFMGGLLVTADVLRLDKGEVHLGINMRRPAGMTAKDFNAKLDAALAKLRAAAPGLREVERYVGDPAAADLSGTLVPALLDIYRKHTGQKDAKAISIRGGTYARLFPGAVDFGPAMPGRPYRGHAPDEYIDTDVLTLTTKMVFDAVVTLTR